MTAYGGVVLSSTGLILLREPMNHYDGYVWTFAKTRVSEGETPEQTAYRAVRSGFATNAKAVGVLPGEYMGGTSLSAFFLMLPQLNHGTLNEHTQATCWANFDQARVLIGKTTNTVGRKRDLAVLEATRQWLERNEKGVIAFEQHGSLGWAVKGDWLTEEMPEQRTTLSLDFNLDAEDVEAIRKGYIPSEMEEKWFSYFVDNVLYQHRSWTGFMIDQITFETTLTGLRAVSAVVNRDPRQYQQTDDAVDIRRIESMVRELAAHNRGR